MTTTIDDTRTTVFVYGSLKEGQGNHSVLRGAKALGRAEVDIEGRFIDLGWFPGVTDDVTGNITRVKGELYAVDSEGLTALDFLEGHPDFYERVKVRTTEGVRTWIYRLPGDSYSIAEFDAIEDALWNPSEEELTHYGLTAEENVEA